MAVIGAVSLLAASGMAQVSEIHRAVGTNDTARVEQLLASNPGLVNEQNPGGSTPLHIAAGTDNPGLVKSLVQHKADINARTKKGFTPLHVAAFVNAAKAAEALIDAGADVSTKANEGSSPLQIAVNRNASAVVAVLTTRTKVVYTERFMDPRCPEAQQAKASGQLQRLYDIYSALREKQPDDERITFAYGMVCMCLDQYSSAQLAFERVVHKINPNNDRARQELAGAYLANRQYDFARREYEEVLARNPDASGNLRENIERCLELAKQSGKKWYLSGRVDAGYFNDSNVNVGP
jgi:tetratricopeptide (TPR) repeat protein